MFPQYVFPDPAQVNDQGLLVIGGCNMLELAEEHGTPVYVFDEETLRGRCRSFVNEFQKLYPASQVLYASKAYINPALAKIFQDEGLGLDVVSGGELAVVRQAGFPLEKVYFHGNNKTTEELAQAVEWRIGHVAVDSFHELALLDEIAGRAGIVQPVMIRVSPSTDPHTHRLTTTGVLDSKFGFPIETGQAKEAVRQAVAAKNLDLEGLHFHLGSPNFELEPSAEAVELVMGFASEMREQGLELRQFSPGGGYAIAYTEADEPPPPSAYAEAIVGAMKRSCASHGMPEPTLLIEPGRAIAGPAGVALYTVGAIKDVPGVRTYVSVDGGMGDNIRPALYGAVYEAVVANAASDPATETVTIAGKYCESGDVLVHDARIAPVEAGSLIAIPASGAYAPSMASTYNLNGRPAIVLVEGGRATLIRRRESYADMMAQDVV